MANVEQKLEDIYRILSVIARKYDEHWYDDWLNTFFITDFLLIIIMMMHHNYF